MTVGILNARCQEFVINSKKCNRVSNSFKQRNKNTFAMSESEDDWFDKDEDEIVKSIQKEKPTQTELEEEFIESIAEVNLTYSSANTNNPPISYKKLLNLSNLEPLELFLNINRTNFIPSCCQVTKVHLLTLIVKLLSKCALLPFTEFLDDHLRVLFADPAFVRNICNLTNKLFAPSEKKFWKENKVDVNEVAHNLLLILEKAVQAGLHNPGLKSVVECLQSALKLKAEDANFSILIEKISKLDTRLNKSVPETKKLELEIFPTLDDLREDKLTLIKPNIVNGQYASVQEYLDIQRTLLKEDFILPLRSAVQIVRGLIPSDEVPDMQLFRNVKILPNNDLRAAKTKMLFVDVFASSIHLWDNTTVSTRVEELKSLICGTLLCFSTTTKFENLILGIVSNSDLEILTKGYINIEVVSQQNVGRVCGIELQMLACPVFFEPYRNAFTVMSTYDETNFPMANYIVHASDKKVAPRYLSESRNKKYVYKNRTFDPLKFETYLGALKNDMTDSQLSAYSLALSSEFSLIQGPPGTGKTEIAVKIAATLLANTTLPIIVIAYTNEALDKFLLKLTPHTNSIVRLGSQSKDVRMEKYNIKGMFASSPGLQNCKYINYKTKMEYMEKFCALHNLQINFDGTEEDFQKILSAQNDLNVVVRKLNCVKMISNYMAIRNKRVIALTTTNAAKHHLMFQLFKDSIVIFEEAAEVLESHIISSITQYTQQVILIGDHYQLRPLTSVYKLSKEYNMNISLFERMVHNNRHMVCLNTQFRMRKEIADLIRPLIYKDLTDDRNVLCYPDVRGIETNLYVVSHQYEENATSNAEVSKFNEYEKKWLCEVAQYLLAQKYTHSDVVLLTTYAKQRDRINTYICQKYPHLQGIQCCTVDGFQGREANIVLLSLVRSNKDKQIGYLKDQNRICVALSRAKLGLYIVGNMSLLAECCGIWKKIKEQLEALNLIGDKLPYKDIN